MSKMIAYKIKIIDNTGGIINVTSIKFSEYPTPGTGQPVSASFNSMSGYVLATAAINNISGLPKMIGIEYTTSDNVVSIIYDNLIDDPNVVSTIIKSGVTIYTRKAIIILSIEDGKNTASIMMVPPTYF